MIFNRLFVSIAICFYVASGLLVPFFVVKAQNLESTTVPFILAVEKDYPPYLFSDVNGVRGIAYEYTKLIAQKMGKQLILSEPLQLQDMLEGVKSGKYNLIADVTKTSDRDLYLEFSDSYLEVPAVVVAQKGSKAVWGEADNSNLRIAVGKGYGVVSFLKNKYPNAQYIELASDREVVKSVAFGSADVGVLDTGSLSYILENAIVSNLEVIGETGFVYSLSFAVSEVDKSAIPLINTAIKQITDDERAAIYAKWLPRIPYRNMFIFTSQTWISIATILILVALIFIWNVVLRLKIRQKTKVLSEFNQRLDALVVEKVKDYEVVQKESNERAANLERTKKAMLNLLEDIQYEKNKLSTITRRLKLATESAHIGVMEMDVVQKKIIGDDITCGLYGVRDSEFDCTFEKWMDYVVPEDRPRVFEKIQKILKEGGLFEDVFRIRRGADEDGEVRYLKGYAQVELDNDGKPVKMTGVNFDVTHDKEVDLAKTEFVSLASHQLLTPVGSISWNLEMLENGDFGPLTEEQKTVVLDMYTMNKRMGELINSLLNVSRIELGVFIIEPSPTDFGKLCDEVLVELAPRLNARHHLLTKKYEGRDINIPADPKLLRIIFQNYLSNAIKYTPENGKIVVDIDKTPDQVIVSVWNNGEPIPEKDQKRIFSKMFRASNAQSQDPDGNGLGLYLVKKIMENAGGKAWFESNAQGTTFYISLPLSGMQAKTGTKRLG